MHLKKSIEWLLYRNCIKHCTIDTLGNVIKFEIFQNVKLSKMQLKQSYHSSNWKDAARKNLLTPSNDATF